MTPELTQTIPNNFLIGALVGIIMGLIIGFLVGARHKNNNSAKALSQLQILSVAIFFGYIVVSALLGEKASEFVAIAILSLTGGEALGLVLQQSVEKIKK